MSFRNLPTVQLIGPGELNAYDVLCNEWIVFTQDVLPSAVARAVEPAATTVEASASGEADAARDESGAAVEPATTVEASASGEADAARDESGAAVEPATKKGDV